MQEKISFIKYMIDVYGPEVLSGKISSPLNDLFQEVKNCQKCDLAKTRRQAVFGSGNPKADILFVGEAPGEQEDIQGLPFVGRAGKLLDAVLQEAGLSREEVFIANVLKCRPPGNRDPLPEEIAVCEPYLKKQIELINPRVIVALGRIAANTLLRGNYSLKDMRGRNYSYHGTDLRVTYHPAAILRNINLLNLLKSDMKAIVKTINE